MSFRAWLKNRGPMDLRRFEGWGPEGWGPEGGGPKGGGPKGGGPEGWGPRRVGARRVAWGPKGGGPEGWGAQNFALFSLSRRKIRSFPPSLGVFSWNFGGVFEGGTLKCARLEFSGCRVKPRRPRSR